ncbi:MAG: BNR/Asp-box repeat protein, partial [Candidatus Eremiobacteraeota bacterium]|nr:BNR/Asp-box repeat protein [Candidatus Eremiobacteraeota bacterium]
MLLSVIRRIAGPAAVLVLCAGAPSVAAEADRPPSPAPAASASPAAAASPSPSPAPALQWRSIGPAVSGGRVAAVAGTDLDPALMYAGAAGGGVWRSTNGGTDWTPVFDKAGTQSIGAIAISPRDKNDVWVGTGEPWPRNDVIPGDGVYHSTDGGKNWAHLGLAQTSQIARVLLDPRDPKRVLVAALGDPFRDSAERGVFRSTDGGATWTKTLYAGAAVGASDLAMDPKNPDVLYAGMWRFRRSAWNLTSGGDDDGIYKSTDGGATWKRVTGNGLPAGTTGRIALAIAPSDAKRIYALVESKDGLLWRSDDAGASWKMTSANTLINERPFYYSRIVVDPHDADHLFSVSVKLAESNTGGKTWHVSGKGLHGDHHDMWIAANGRAIVEANDGGVGLSRDGGA